MLNTESSRSHFIASLSLALLAVPKVGFLEVPALDRPVSEVVDRSGGSSTEQLLLHRKGIQGPMDQKHTRTAELSGTRTTPSTVGDEELDRAHRASSWEGLAILGGILVAGALGLYRRFANIAKMHKT